MTFEKRCTIEPSDVLALVYECGKCGAATRIPASLAEAVSGLLTRNCVQCGAETGIKNGTTEHDDLVAFCSTIGRSAKAAQGRTLKIKMELKCSELEDGNEPRRRIA